MMLRFRLFPRPCYRTDKISLLMPIRSTTSPIKLLALFEILQSCDSDRPLVVYLDDLANNHAKPHSLVVGQ
jgi:hypothetical protein